MIIVIAGGVGVLAAGFAFERVRMAWAGARPARGMHGRITTVRLKVEQIQLLSVVGLFRCGLIAREGA